MKRTLAGLLILGGMLTAGPAYSATIETTTTVGQDADLEFWATEKQTLAVDLWQQACDEGWLPYTQQRLSIERSRRIRAYDAADAATKDKVDEALEPYMRDETQTVKPPRK